jgi:hypothetical protein
LADTLKWSVKLQQLSAVFCSRTFICIFSQHRIVYFHSVLTYGRVVCILDTACVYVLCTKYCVYLALFVVYVHHVIFWSTNTDYSHVAFVGIWIGSCIRDTFGIGNVRLLTSLEVPWGFYSLSEITASSYVPKLRPYSLIWHLGDSDSAVVRTMPCKHSGCGFEFGTYLCLWELFSRIVQLWFGHWLDTFSHFSWTLTRSRQICIGMPQIHYQLNPCLEMGGLWHYTSNLQVVGSKLAHTCVCGFSTVGRHPLPIFPTRDQYPSWISQLNLVFKKKRCWFYFVLNTSLLDKMMMIDVLWPLLWT